MGQDGGTGSIRLVRLVGIEQSDFARLVADGYAGAPATEPVEQRSI